MSDVETNPNDGTLTIVQTAVAADANLLPINHEPVGAKRQARDFKPLIEDGRLMPAPSADEVFMTSILFADKIKAVGIDPARVAYVLMGDPKAADSAGIWVTTVDEEVGDTALFTRIL